MASAEATAMVFCLNMSNFLWCATKSQVDLQPLWLCADEPREEQGNARAPIDCSGMSVAVPGSQILDVSFRQDFS
jgi:hypothetical protein